MEFYKNGTFPKLPTTATNEKIIEWIQNNKELLENKILSLYFMDFDLSAFPSSLTFRSLKILDLDNNNLTKINVITENCFNLVELSIFMNKIKEIPRSIENLKHLEKAYFECNEIKYIPEELKNCKKLEILYLSENKLEKEINLPLMLNLKELDLAYNKIEHITGFKNLLNLKFLMLLGNKIKIILQEIENCKHLEYISSNSRKLLIKLI